MGQAQLKTLRGKKVRKSWSIRGFGTKSVVMTDYVLHIHKFVLQIGEAWCLNSVNTNKFQYKNEVQDPGLYLFILGSTQRPVVFRVFRGIVRPLVVGRWHF